RIMRGSLPAGRRGDPSRIRARDPRGAASVDDLAVRAVQVGQLDRPAELGQRPGLDLAHALARDAEVVARLLERARDAVVEPGADPQHLLRALPQRAQPPAELLVLELQLHQPLHAHRRTAQVLGRELLESLYALVFV